MLSDSAGQAPLLPASSIPPGLIELDDVLPMNVDYVRCAEILERIMPRLKEWVDSR
jgi:hypothetical protein